MKTPVKYFLLLALMFVGVFMMGCEETAYLYAPEPPDPMYGSWTASNPESVGLDELRLDLWEDGDYHYYGRAGHFEYIESGTWDYTGHHEMCFYSEYVNGREDGASYNAKVWVLDDDELKIKYLDTDCECPVFLERDCGCSAAP